MGSLDAAGRTTVGAVPTLAVLARALDALVLALVPIVASPEPAPRTPAAVWALAAVLALGALVLAARRLRRHVPGAAARVAEIAAWTTAAAAVVAAHVWSGDSAPLARGVWLVAAPLWVGLAAAAVALSGEHLGSSFKNKRTIAALAVVLGGGAMFTKAQPMLGTHDAMWREVLRRDPGNERAVDAVAWPAWERGKLDDVRRIADRCLGRAPSACSCLVLRADALVRGKAAATAQPRRSEALQSARAVAETCGERALAHAVLAELLAEAGDAAGAEREAAAGLSIPPGPLPAGDHRGRLHRARAAALVSMGRLDEALGEARSAAARGAPRDGRLLEARIVEQKGDPRAALASLERLASDYPDDAEVRAAAASALERAGELAKARDAWRVVLRLEPRDADALHALALVLYRLGSVEEAKREAKRFGEIFPDDERRKTLAAAVGGF